MECVLIFECYEISDVMMKQGSVKCTGSPGPVLYKLVLKLNDTSVTFCHDTCLEYDNNLSI